MTDYLDPHSIPKNQIFLYADDGYDSHVIRYLLAEKRLSYKLSHLVSERPEDLAELNPYRTLPILIHADIILYEINIIFEYLEERHHNHKLLPESPQHRAEARQLAWRIQKDWLSLGRQLLIHPDSFDPKSASVAKKQLTDSLITLSPIFSHKKFFMADELGWCDIILVPLLWQLDHTNLSMPSHLTRSLNEYKKRMFERKAFQESLRTQI